MLRKNHHCICLCCNVKDVSRATRLAGKANSVIMSSKCVDASALHTHGCTCRKWRVAPSPGKCCAASVLQPHNAQPRTCCRRAPASPARCSPTQPQPLPPMGRPLAPLTPAPAPGTVLPTAAQKTKSRTGCVRAPASPARCSPPQTLPPIGRPPAPLTLAPAPGTVLLTAAQKSKPRTGCGQAA
eukprot:scaffold128563_cov15-Tisochrysis_lutea.AAC.1